MQNTSRWIWPGAYAAGVNQYVQFRHLFDVKSGESVGQLSVSCEGNFTAFVNGRLALTGQFSDFPEAPTFSVAEIGDLLVEGPNELVIVGYHFGVDHFSHIPGPASLVYELVSDDVMIASGTATEYRLDPCYRSGEIERLTPQLGYVFEYDARRNGGAWIGITERDFVDRPMPTPRPLPLLELKPATPMRVIEEGTFLRPEDSSARTFGELMQADRLSAAATDETGQRIEVNGDGRYMIIDMGREECGFITLDVEAQAGTVLDIAVGQHIENMRVYVCGGGRNFASRYICAEGRQTFVHYNNRYSGRYIQIHILSASGGFTLHHAGLIPAEYPLDVRGQFESSDSLINQINAVCARTLHLCMHEHYEDTPWREQALYANDSRNQALAGYAAFGEFEFPKVSFDILGQGLRADHFIPLMAPSHAAAFAIPSFTLAWVAAIHDCLMYTGDTDYVGGQMPRIQTILDAMLATCEDHLLPCPKGPAYWQFYDWEDGLDGVDGAVSDWRWVEITTPRYDAPLNLFFVLALRAAADIAGYIGNQRQAEIYFAAADKTAQAVDKAFRVDGKVGYQTYIGEQGIPNHYCELTQALAVLAGVGGDKVRNLLLDSGNGLVPTSLSQSLYTYQALFQGTPAHGRRAFEDMRKQWGYMLDNGATSFWEMIEGASAFDGAGSLCHGWSAIPAWFFQTRVLGITPVEPGFKRFNVAPVPGLLAQAEGKVPTPSGTIDVSIAGTSVTVSFPKDLQRQYPSDDTHHQFSFRER